MKNIDPKLLAAHIDKKSPFSPLDAGVVKDIFVSQELFYSKIPLVSSYSKNRNVLIGRRGSGKTALLTNTAISTSHDLVVRISKSKILGDIVLSVHGIPMGGRYPEAVAEIWESVISTIVLGEAVKRFPELKLTKDYLGKIGAGPKSTDENLAWLLLDTLRETQKGKTVGTIAEFVRKLHRVSFKDAKSELIELLKDRGKRAVVLIDSLESEGYLLDDPDTASALKGLLKWVGNTSEEPGPIDVRFCIPGEYYFQFLELSSNPIKDFAKATTIQWRANELASIAASRFMSYLYVYDNNKYTQWKNTDFKIRSNSLKLINEFLPIKMKMPGSAKESCFFLYIKTYTVVTPPVIFNIKSRI